MSQTKPIYPTKKKIMVDGVKITIEDYYHNNDQCTGYQTLKESDSYSWGTPDNKELCEQCQKLNK